jgi:superfamily II DNA or RNA helicase
MTTQSLQWLELSPPPVIAGPQPMPPGQSPCPDCGWPTPAEVPVCPHCGHNFTAAAESSLARLGLELPPPRLEVLPPPAAWFDGSPPAPPMLYQLRLQAERLQTTTGFDRLICLDDISVDHYPHQLEAALHALRDMRGRALLADEVGLGKTIEAGIIMKELIERGLVNSVLIVTPASLTHQWAEEMAAKFHEQFIVLEQPEELPPPVEGQPGRWLISLDRAKAGRWAESLLARSYDLLIVDEAHKLKNHQTRGYKFINQLRKQYVLMLTATPVHNNLLELYNLITILRPGHLGTRAAFRDSFLQPQPRRSFLRTIYSTTSPPTYLRMSQTERQKYREAGQGGWFNRHIDDFTRLDKLRLDRGGQQAVVQVRQLLDDGYELHDFEAIRPHFWADDQFVCRLRLNRDEDNRPRARTRPLTPTNPIALRQLLQEVMIRNRRSHVGIELPPRRAAIYAFHLPPEERELYDKTTMYIRHLLRELPAGQSRGALRMSLITLQKQLCSTPQAAIPALRRLVGQHPTDPLPAEALVLALGIQECQKIAATRQLLAEFPGKFLIFADFLPSVEALHAALTADGIEAVTFHGGMSALERAGAVRRFRHSARVMISTQSGSEGHNLQFCHQLINFDLPWNPMRLEQRVGRLHRLGQTEPVSIFNLSAADTIEAYILNVLAHKIRMFELVIGELDLILGQLDDRRGFEQRLESAWADSQSEADLLRMMADLENILVDARQTYQTIRAKSDDLSDLLDAIDEVQP